MPHKIWNDGTVRSATLAKDALAVIALAPLHLFMEAVWWYYIIFLEPNEKRPTVLEMLTPLPPALLALVAIVSVFGLAYGITQESFWWFFGSVAAYLACGLAAIKMNPFEN